MTRLICKPIGVLIFLLVTIPSAWAEAPHSFLPENALWLEDGLLENSQITQKQFDDTLYAVEKIYLPIGLKHGETIVVNHLWDDPTVNAYVKRITDDSQIIINMYGGLARRPEVNMESLALVLCHELGHAFGGPPYLIPESSLSAEGIADDYAARTCLGLVLKNTSPSFDTHEEIEYSTQKCREKYPNNESGHSLCVRSLEASLGLGRLFAALSKENEPSFTTPDLFQTEKTLVSYPKTSQCRLDTYHNAVLSLEKPRCWFNPNN